MSNENLILDKLTEIASKLGEQNLLKKTVLNFGETCKYLDISKSHLYKLTSTKQIPHFCPQGKKLYFNREELDDWLQRNHRLKFVLRIKNIVLKIGRWLFTHIFDLLESVSLLL